MICSVFLHRAHDAPGRVVSKVHPRRLERGEGPKPPVLLRSEQVVNLPGHRSRQAPPAAAGAQTRRACFRGFNPQVSGPSSAVAESPAAGAAHVAAASRTPPPPRQRSPRLLLTRGGVEGGKRRPPPRRARPSDAAAPQPQPNGFPDAGSRVPRRLSPQSPAAPRRRKADPLACLVRGSGSSSHYLDGGPGSRGAAAALTVRGCFPRQ